ncbi:MAG: helix-turn-helix domain-containing protein [Pseudomonadota bacterium]
MPGQSSKTCIHWTPLVDAHARLLAALELSYREIARRLGCDHSTIKRRIGPPVETRNKSESEILALFESYDTLRCITQAIESPVASVDLARLRTGLRSRRSMRAPDKNTRSEPAERELSDEEICAELERLVGRPFKVEGGS